MRARGGEEHIFAGSDEYNDVAWCGDNCKESQPVGLLKPNGYGLYDMSGCVAEYTSTPFMKVVPSDPLTHEPSLSNQMSVRGGGWWELFLLAVWRNEMFQCSLREEVIEAFDCVVLHHNYVCVKTSQSSPI